MSIVEAERALANLRKKRSAIKGAMTKLGHRLQELEDEPNSPNRFRSATLMMEKVRGLEGDYKVVHDQIVESVDIEEAAELEHEQDVTDRQDEFNCQLILRLRAILEDNNEKEQSEINTADRKLGRLRTSLQEVKDGLAALDGSTEHAATVQQYTEELASFKQDLRSLNEELLKLDLDDDHELVVGHAVLKRLHFECACTNIGLALKLTESKTSASRHIASKLPKLQVPTFNGELLKWRTFWDMFRVSVHTQESMSNTEKLLYLRQAVGGGPANQVIDGLSHTGDQYEEAIACLMKRYNQPRAVHEAYVRVIVEYPKMKDGTGKELRKLHDVMLQNLRALNTMGHDTDSQFITSLIQLKLDPLTSFAWREASKASVENVPEYEDLLKFLDQRARSADDQGMVKRSFQSTAPLRKPVGSPRSVAAHVVTSDMSGNCHLCHGERHPLYFCPIFKAMPVGEKRSMLAARNLCYNCLRAGHRVNQCRSEHRCKRCQKPHHTTLHQEQETSSNATTESGNRNSKSNAEGNSRSYRSMPPADQQVTSNAAVVLKASSLLMTCKIVVTSPNGNSTEARAILDTGSTASFVTERLASALRLPRSRQMIHISGITGAATGAPTQTVATCKIGPVYGDREPLDITAIVLPAVTRELPINRVPFQPDWNHLDGLNLADPTFGEPGRIDVLLGADICVETIRHGRAIGPPGAPKALETGFGWVLCGDVDGVPEKARACTHVSVHHSLTTSVDDLLRRFWEVEEGPSSNSTLTRPEKEVMKHFDDTHSRTIEGRFVVPLPRKPDAKPLGESRLQAVRRFKSLERSLHHNKRFQEVDQVLQEYLDLGHAELVPKSDSQKNMQEVFYMPIHVVYKEASTSTKIRAVFDASAKTTNGVSLNDTLMVGPTVHPQLLDVLLRFRTKKVALTTDISKMYRAVLLTESDRDYHRFVWRKHPDQPINDYRMMRVTFGVAASCFAANMAVKQNAQELSIEYPLASKAAQESFYVDDGLTRADTTREAIKLREQLQRMFTKACFELRKRNSSEPKVLASVPLTLREAEEVLSISDDGTGVAKTLGIQWNTRTDSFMLATTEFEPTERVTKRILLSDISKVFDALGWFSPAIISVKILLQRTWECNVGWDDPIPDHILDKWEAWRTELPILTNIHLKRCYYLKTETLKSTEMHGFCDASEEAYAAVVYLKSTYTSGQVHISLIMAKTKVAPIKRQSIPRLELCGALMLSRILRHLKETLQVSITNTIAWTDSTIVLDWLCGNPRRFKTFVGNRVSEIMDNTPPNCWRHVPTEDNPADCASRGISPSELQQHRLWWKGPSWLTSDSSTWPATPGRTNQQTADELITRFSSYHKLIRVTAWTARFIAKARRQPLADSSAHLTVREILQAEQRLLATSQAQDFGEEITAIKAKKNLPRVSNLKHLFPFLDNSGLIRGGGRIRKSNVDYDQKHPVILHGKHSLAKLIIRAEHLRLLHSGPNLTLNSLSRHFHLIGGLKAVRTVTRQCIVCRRNSIRPTMQLVGQLPKERVTPEHVFEHVGLDYAGPLMLKLGRVRKPTLVKAYVCVFVSLSVKAVHLEAVTDLTTEAFIAALRRFIARRGLPSTIHSDNGSNFIGANNEISHWYSFLKQSDTQTAITEACSRQKIQWKFIPGRAPHFGGLWEAAVKSAKNQLRKIVGTVRLTFEELTTVLTQVEACMNSRPLTPMVSIDGEGVEALTPGHFLIGRPLCALPEHPVSTKNPLLLRRWQLCQHLTRHFWMRWSNEYLNTLRKFYKWHNPQKNLQPGEVVILQEDGIPTNHWPLGRIQEVFPGEDGLVRAATVKTTRGTYRRPIVKLYPLFVLEENTIGRQDVLGGRMFKGDQPQNDQVTRVTKPSVNI